MHFDSPSAEPLGCSYAEPTENGKATTSSGCGFYLTDFAKAYENAEEHIAFKMQAPSTPMSLTFNASVLVNSQDEGWSYTYVAGAVAFVQTN